MPDKKQSIILGAVVAALLSTSYLGFINCLCCLGVILSGMLTVWHYTSNNELTIKPGEGAVMGLIAVAIGSFVAIFLNFALIKMGIRADQAISQTILNWMGDNMPPEQAEKMREQMDQPVTFGKHFLQGLLGVAIGGAFGAIGGVIGAALFKRGGETPDVTTTVE